MRKKFSIVLSLLLGIILICSLAACAKTVDPNSLKDEILPEPASAPNTYFKFSFPRHANSALNAIPLDEFDLTQDVKYAIVRLSDDGDVISEQDMGGISEDMVVAADRDKLNRQGHWDIHVTDTLTDGKTVSGMFRLHLKQVGEPEEHIVLTFELGSGGHAMFGTGGQIAVEKGVTIASWEEFVNTFPVRNPTMALTQYTVGSSKVISPTAGFPLTLNADARFTATWTRDVIGVSFDLNAPTESFTGSDPKNELNSGGALAPQNVARNTGFVVRPDEEKFNKYNGYEFAGWYDKATGRVFNFSQTVGNAAVQLEAHWKVRTYNFVLYSMGGDFAQTLTGATLTDGAPATSDNLPEGSQLVQATSRFSLSTGALNRVVFSGLLFGKTFDNIYAEVTVQPEKGEQPAKTLILKLSDFRTADGINKLFDKGAPVTVDGAGDGQVTDYITATGLYNNYQCTDAFTTSQPDAVGKEPQADGEEVYVGWDFNPAGNEPGSEEYVKRISAYYAYVYSGGISVKADGSLRLDRQADAFVNELIIPAEIYYGGAKKAISEIGEAASISQRALNSIDFSAAVNLTTIGARAFQLCPHLQTVTFPAAQSNAVTLIGRDAFDGSAYEENYAQTNSKNAIIIAGVLYKYVDANKALTSVDLTEFQDDDAIVSIMDGAFSDYEQLTSVTLSASVKRIENNAFEGLLHLENVTVPTDSALEFIGETAFDDESTLMSRGNVGNAVIIGNIYYRYTNRGATSVEVPAKNGDFTVSYIAPRAFKGCSKLAQLTFVNESDIAYIGKDALLDTAYIRSAERVNHFTVINGILAAYYNATDTSQNNVVIPENVTQIAEGVFASNATLMTTVQLNAGVTVADYAFAGAPRLESVIATAVTVEDGKLSGAPVISANSFAQSDGSLMAVTFYMKSAAIELLSTDVEDTSSFDAVTLSWYNLYRHESSNFEIEDVEDVRLDTSKVVTTLLRKGEKANAFLDLYGEEQDIADALIITDNAGLVKREALNYTFNSVEFVEVNADSNFDGVTYNPDLKQYVMNLTYMGEIVSQIRNEAGGIVVFTVYDAIKGLPKFYASSNYDYDTTRRNLSEYSDKNDMYITGAETQVQGNIATYWTSHGEFTLVFRYTDIDGHTQTLPINARNITGLSAATPTLDTPRTASITVNFYGIGTYVFRLDYRVLVPQYEGMAQTTPISVPVNSDLVSVLGTYSLQMIKQDGKKEMKRISADNFIIESGKDATKLGHNTLTVTYQRADATAILRLQIHYIVVLEADQSMFTFQVINEQAKTARIVGFTGAMGVATVIIPATCQIKGAQYTVTEIGNALTGTKGVFEGLTYLKEVYLSSNVKVIGVNTFKGCTALSGIYTAREESGADVTLTAANLEIIGTSEDGKTNYAALVNLEGVEASPVEDGEGAPTRYVVSFAPSYEIDGVTTVISELRAIDITGEFGDGDVNFYLPDTVYIFTQAAISVNGVPVSDAEMVTFYSSDSARFRVFRRTNAALQQIGNSAFSGCAGLQSITLAYSTELEYIGSNAFEGTSLTSINLRFNRKITAIDAQTFKGAGVLQSVSLPDTIQGIGNEAFKDCKALNQILVFAEGAQSTEGKDFTAAKQLKFVGDRAFENCSSLTSLAFGASLTDLGSRVFSGCTQLTLHFTFDQTAIPHGWSADWNNDGLPVDWNYKG